MNAPFILRNKQFNKLSNKEKENIISQVKQAYIDEGLGINELIDYGINSKINVFFNEIILYFKQELLLNIYSHNRI